MNWYNKASRTAEPWMWGGIGAMCIFLVVGGVAAIGHELSKDNAASKVKAQCAKLGYPQSFITERGRYGYCVRVVNGTTEVHEL